MRVGRSPDPLAGYSGPTSNGREEQGREGAGREGREREREKRKEKRGKEGAVILGTGLWDRERREGSAREEQVQDE